MPTIRRHREPLDPSIALAADGTQELPAPRAMLPGPVPAPYAEPNRRKGNQNARTHGIYAAEPGDPEDARLRILRDIDNAMKRADHRALMRHARALRDLGDRDFAAVVRAQARVLRDQEERRTGNRRQRHGSPARILRDWQAERSHQHRKEGTAATPGPTDNHPTR
jgi:hypothetical protein